MDAKHVNPFLKAVENILGQFGITGFKKSSVKVKEEMSIDKDITAFVGIIGTLRGNISFSFNKDVARNVVSGMMMGMPVEAIDEMAISAIAEMSNMITGNAVSQEELSDYNLDITPPAVIIGEDLFFVLGTVKTLAVAVDTSAGEIEINFGLES